MTEDHLQGLADRLVDIDGVRAVLLGGSRARGDHTPQSDYDLGLYYEPSLDVAAIQALAHEVAGPEARVTVPGAWGPWVDGGGWFTIEGSAVDWIYRDLGRVRRSWADAQVGRFSYHAQVGHPLGVPDFAYAAEVALGIVLADPTGELTALQRSAREYPPALANALVEGLWEAHFLIANARKAVVRADTTYVAGCLFRVVELCAHALHGRARQWLTNEKGAVRLAAALPDAPVDFDVRAHAVLAGMGSTPKQLALTIDAAEELLKATVAACENNSE
ncbi:MAG TPA: nucleotidyltransferase domain-containing protein [Nocardioidaceae bacterium]|nr:nucleotidyltransferase domain-containing protein [Nocardioidaceae bacterium]